MRNITKIILHCSATKEGRHYSVSDIRDWHIQRGFNDVGYHFIIYNDGTIVEGRPIEQMGAHCSGQNKNSIGICYIGGLDYEGKPKDTRTQRQKESMRVLVKSLMYKYQITQQNIYGHSHFSNKACPCFDIEEFKDEL